MVKKSIYKHQKPNSLGQDQFESIAEYYDDVFPSHITAHYLNKRIRFIKKIIKQGSVLNVGCGTGLLANSLEKEGFAVTGLDSSSEMLEQAKKRGVKTVLGVSDSLPFKANQFNLVVCIGTLHHIADQDKIAKSIKEMVRVVKPGCPVVIWDHNPNNPYWPILMRRLPQDRGITRLVPLGEIVEVLKKMGVSKIKVYRKGFVPDFAPRFLMPVISGIEFVCERLPLVRFLAAGNVAVAYKKDSS